MFHCSACHRFLRSIGLAAAVAVMLNIFYADNLWAAPPTLSERKEINQRAKQEAREREMRAQQQDVFLREEQPAGEATQLPDEAVSFPVHTLRLTGEYADRFPWAQAILEQYTEKKIGKEGINLIVKRLTGEFVRRGYVTTRVVIPEQDLSTGTLEVVLIPGIIRDIRFAAPGRGNWQTAFPVRPGDMLNIRDLEQGLEQLKRVPSQDVGIHLVPGEKPGESDIIITQKLSKPWKLLLSADNSGYQSTGEQQASLTLSLDNLLGGNDLFNISVNRDAESENNVRGTRGDSIYYSLPYGYWTFSLNGSRFNYHQTVGSGATSYVSLGESDSLELGGRRIIHRDQHSKIGFGVKLIRKHSKSFIDDTEIIVQRNNTTAVEFSLFQRKYIGQAVLDLELAERSGVPWCGAQGEPDSLPAGVATTRYHLWSLDANFTKPVKIGKTSAWYTGHLRAQACNDVLYAIDQLSIGNRYTVRGFDGEQVLSAENGVYLRNELDFPIGKGQEVYWGLDYGRVGGYSAQWLLGKTLIGTALGLRGGGHGLQYDAFIGWPLKKPHGFKTSPSTLGFQLTYII